MADRVTESAAKLARVRDLLAQLDLDGIVFTGQNNVSWITAGIEDLIIRGMDPGLVWALVTSEQAMLVTQNVEGPRVEAEEHATELGFEVVTFPWYEDAWPEIVEHLVPAERLGNDGAGPGRSIARELSTLKVELMPEELERLRVLGVDAATAIEGVMCGLNADLTEREVAAEFVRELELLRIFPTLTFSSPYDLRQPSRAKCACGARRRARWSQHRTLAQRRIWGWRCGAHPASCSCR